MTQTSVQSKRVERTFTGVVTSNKMPKTIVVQIDRTVVHPKYNKRYTRSRKYKVHDEKNEAKIGELVTFVECRPLSKDKRWRLVRKA